MANISHDEVEHVARLAKLDLTEPEKTLFGEQLSQILNFVEQLQEVSTEGIAKLYKCRHPNNRGRNRTSESDFVLQMAIPSNSRLISVGVPADTGRRSRKKAATAGNDAVILRGFGPSRASRIH